MERPRIGFYRINSRNLVSVTSAKEFVLGTPLMREVWNLKQTLLATMRKQKELKRNLTQKEAIEFGREARAEILEKSRQAGVETHTAIQNHNDGSKYELVDDHKPLFEAYQNWAKGRIIKPILQEYQVKNFEHSYAGRLDFYGEVDGKRVLIDYKTSNFIDWTFGLQLAAYKECLIKEGFPVDEMLVLHLKPRQRGGNPIAEAYYFTTPFESWVSLMNLFQTKIAHDPEVDWYPRNEESAIKADLGIKEEEDPMMVELDPQRAVAAIERSERASTQ